jgi:acetolactate synthase-1/2/3 large subunit
MPGHYTVSDLIAEFLDRCGAETGFGIVSVHNIPLLDAISRRNRMRFVTPRGEMGAAHMADGYARASGQVGALVTSTGPGAANAVSGLVEARFAGSPILHLTGQTSTRFVDRGMGSVHDVPDQLGIMRAAGKAAWRIRHARDALAVLKEAMLAALTPPRGPVTVEVPIDIQREAIERPASLDHYELPRFSPPLVCESEMAWLADQVAAARRPMLWLGRGASGARAEALGLLGLGFGMVTSWAGRGVVDEEHPMNIGSLNGAGLETMERFYETVDLMVVVGSRMRGHETLDFTAPVPARIIQVDIDPRADGRTYPNVGFVAGDAAQVLAELHRRVAGRLLVDPAFAADVGGTKRDARISFARTLGPYADFAEQLRAVMPRDAIWARDITINNSTWGNKLLPIDDPRANIYPIGAGIGQGLCLGIGAALAAPMRKTVAMTGDGGFFLNLSELWTAVQEELNITILVMNDGGYGVIRHIQDKAAGGRRRFDTLLAPELEGVAAIANIPYWRVSDAAAFGATVAEALAFTGPSIVEVDMGVIGDHPPYFPYGPKASSRLAKG